MKQNTYKGILIALDGPNGVGKSTIVQKLKEVFVKKGYDVYATKEPTENELGDYVRSFSEKHKGISLACLVAGDRYEHIENEIIPALKKGKIVITDRYILSSLILQGMDGVDADYILKINSKVIKPDLQVAVSADESRLQERLSERQMLSRFEKGNQSEKELYYMKQGIKMLLHEKVQILEVCNNNDVEEEVRQITSYVEKIWRNH